MDLDQLRTATSQLLDLAGARASGPARPPSQRRPRARGPYALRIRADLAGAEPAVWRRLELPSTLYLDEMHDLLQAVFGWTDSHLHRFTLGASAFDSGAEHFLCPYDVEEGEDEGVPAQDVRLDETLAEVGDELRYTYDYGDEWVLVLTVEQVLPATTPVAVTGGAGAPPPDDVGGIHAWDEERDDAADAPCDRQDCADLLAGWERDRPLRPDLRVLRGHLWGTPELELLEELVEQADLREGQVEVVEAAERELLRPYWWLLDRVGDGIMLTAAGYLPPALVLAATTELGLDRDWIGKGNREDLSWPVAQLRSSAQALGLLRKTKGRLLRSKVGVAVTDDPVALWRHLGTRLGARPADPVTSVAGGLVLLGATAGRSSDELEPVLAAAGWQSSDGGRPGLRAGLVGDVLDVLRRSHPESRGAAPAPELRALARLALRSSRL